MANDMTVNPLGASNVQPGVAAGESLPGPTITWQPAAKEEFIKDFWFANGGSKDTSYLARLAFLKLNGLDQKEFDFWTDIKKGASYVVPNPVDVEQNFEKWAAYVGKVDESSPAFRSVQKDIVEHPMALGKKVSASTNGHEGLASAIGARPAGIKVSGAQSSQITEGPSAGSPTAESVKAAQVAMEKADDVRKPGFLNKVAEVLELFFRWTSPLFNMLMLYVRVMRVAFTWVKNFLADTSIGKSLGLKETKIDWGAEFKRGLADFAGIIFPPLGAIGHAGINYWFDKEPAEQWGGLNYYVPGQKDKQYAFKKELDWAFGKLKAGKDAVVSKTREVTAKATENVDVSGVKPAVETPTI